MGVRKLLSKFLHRRSSPEERPIAAESITPPASLAVEEKPISAVTLSDDLPIEIPESDLFGLAPFSKSLADSIAGIHAPKGIVVGIHGAWGSGKSSAINLALHYLKPAIEEKRIITVRFNPWWFSGSQSLTTSFFREIGAVLSRSLPEKALDSFNVVASRISNAAPIVGAVTDLAAPGLGNLVTAGVGSLNFGQKTIEQEYDVLSSSLEKQASRFLVVIDDLDRLSPDDALTMFKLVKSVGRLPNVVYLLAFDREVADKIVNERFPSEGRHYLDKVIQATFELPAPDPTSLRDAFLNSYAGICGVPNEEKMIRFMNLFYDIVAPKLLKPRDLVRLINNIKISWPSVVGRVDRADSLSIEAIRSFSPLLYDAIRTNKDLLCGAGGRDGNRSQQGLADKYEEIFISHLEDSTEWAKTALKRLFPRTQGVWGNVFHTDSESWRRDRLVCATEHFSTYFGSFEHDNGFSDEELKELLEVVGNSEFSDYLNRKRSQKRRNGASGLPLVLDELTLHSSAIDTAAIPAAITTLFSMADANNLQQDRSGDSNWINNNLRLHWLVNKLVFDRLPLEQRSEILLSCSGNAGLVWIVNFATRMWRDHNPSEGDQNHGNDRFVTKDASEKFRSLAVNRLREASDDETLQTHDDFIGLLIRWRNLAPADEERIRKFVEDGIANVDFLVAFLKSSISEGWSQGIGGFGMLGDRVARRTKHVSIKAFENFISMEQLMSRVDQTMRDTSVSEEIRKFLDEFSILKANSENTNW